MGTNGNKKTKKEMLAKYPSLATKTGWSKKAFEKNPGDVKRLLNEVGKRANANRYAANARSNVAKNALLSLVGHHLLTSKDPVDLHVLVNGASTNNVKIALGSKRPKSVTGALRFDMDMYKKLARREAKILRKLSEMKKNPVLYSQQSGMLEGMAMKAELEQMKLLENVRKGARKARSINAALANEANDLLNSILRGFSNAVNARRGLGNAVANRGNAIANQWARHAVENQSEGSGSEFGSQATARSSNSSNSRSRSNRSNGSNGSSNNRKRKR